MVRALELFYEATGGNAWRNNFKWLSGEPCVDGWFGVHCCPQELPVLRGDDECTAEGGGATGVRTTQGSAACHSGSTTGTALDLATCFVVKVLLPSNNLVGSLDGALCELPFLQHLDLSGNVLTGSLPSAADCLPRLTYLDLTQTRSWDDEGGVSGRVPEWLLDRLDFMAPLRLANNALDDPTAAESAVAISRIWQRCQTLGAEQCSGVPPIGCSAFNRQGQRYEVELDGLGCVRCPTPLEMGLVGGGIAFIVLLLAWLLGLYTRFMRKYPEHAKIRFATFMILVGHLQTLTIIGSMQLGWPLIIQEILASINLPFLSYIPLPCILTDPVVKALLSYAETAGVLLLLLGARLVASEYYLSVLFSFLFTFGLRASVTLFMRYDEDQTRLIIARLVASLLWLFWLFLLRRFHWLLREARVTAAAKVAPALAGRIEMGEYVVVNGRRGKITSDNRTSNPYQVTFDNGEVSGWLFPHGVTRDVTRAARAARVKSVIRQKKARRAAEAVRHLTERYASDDGPSHGEFLLWAEGKIDGPIRERLKDGTIRLLRCAWLLSKDSDRHLGRDASCKVILRRRQELPEEAFFTKEEAVELLDRADRSILALSYRWLTREHPDPHGTALSAVRRFLRSKDGLGKCGMFWDFASLPQKDIAKEARGLPPRTPEEAATMKRGLDGMGYFYASVCGTAVVQLKDIPPRPSEYDGRMIVFDEEYSEMTIVKDLIADLERFGGKITEIAIRPTVISATHKQEGEAHVTFATHKQAERCITALREVGRGACTVYNETAYSSDRGETFSGWCTFEQGCSKLVVAHLNKASRQASSRLPERLVRANASRAKVTDISEEKVSPVDVKESPAAILKQSNKDIEKATFVGKGEAETVKQLLATLEGSMKRAMEEAKADPATADQLARARWPLRSQWQLVVWARQGLLFLVSFAMDCVMWFSPYEAHRTARYVFAAIAIAVLGGFWWLQARRQPYAMRQQHWLEAFLLAVDILAIVLACVYGALTNDGTVQDGFGRLALELGLGALLIVSVVGAALLILFEYAYERWYRRQWYLHHGLVKALEGTKEARQIIDEPIEAALRDVVVTFHLSTFDEAATLTATDLRRKAKATFSSPSWYDPKETLRFGAHVDQGPLTVLKFEWECVATERVATEEEAQVCIDKLVTLCEQEGWGAYRFDEGEYRIDNGRYISEGYVRFLKAGDADAARRHSDFKRMCGGKEQKKTKFLRMCAEAKAKAMELFQMCGNAKAKAKAKSELNEPTLMGEHVFENELKFKRGLSVMGSLYASATGTCVLQLTDPPGMLGHDGAPSELVSERTGTVFVIEDKSLKDMSLEELQMELGDGVLAWEKGSWDKVVVRVDDETAARAARSLNERGYPLRRKDRKVKSMYNLRPYDSRGWPTFERSAASIVLAHVTQRKRLGEKLSEELKQAEASSLKLINIDVTGAPREVVVAQSPEHHLRECKKLMLSKRIVFTGRADQKQVVQLLSDFEDSIAVQFDQKRAEHLNLCTEHLEHALALANSSEVTKDPLFASSDKLTRDYPTSVRHSTNYRRSHKDLMDEMVLKSVPGRTRMRTLGTMPGNEPSAPIPEGTEMSSIVGWGEGSSQRAKERSTEMSSVAGGLMHVVKHLSWKELTLKERLGAGSFGEVRVAVWNSTPCAIKSLRAATTPAALQELLNEFELTMRLHHPNVLLTMGIAHDDDDGKTGILMELMPASLLDVLHHHQQREQLATWEASLVLIALDVAKGMAYLHAMDVVHRDLKPGNVLLTEHWVAKVADFGTALTKYAGHAGHAEGAAGTPPYMAPEAIALTSGAKAKPTDGRSA
ncbi:map3k delta-1 protein kinase [Chrysochromulina tobinii]|uniref:Map3k delta-1 protein kinase n=1 Tax=Chrysochromulina tobinii TaxID=1460289 RepID=A0A0M0JKJ5_9EUKA|nr:map3k delta-1 protein kinase [Chrysochromulina tobinii]|eukprot:KOO26862.1 map3k delta-1 protein kinase [Chrysochromulina sp. CCMP291]